MPTYKIFHLIGGGEIGGAEEHILTLLPNLDSRFEPYLICLVDGPMAKLAQEKGIPTACFPMKNPLDVRTLPGLTSWAREREASLFHTHGSRANLLGRLGAKWLGIPSVSTVHSSLAHDYLSPRAAQFALALDRLTLPLTSGVIAVSDYLRAEVAGRGGKNVRTIYNGKDPLPSSPSSTRRSLFRQQWGIPDDAYVIGNIARLHPTKGQEYLVRAASILQAKIPNLHLLLIGDGPLSSQLARELQELKVPYTMPGYIPNAFEALPAMDLFALPSLSEGMGLVLLEAMQEGVPIVATHVGGVPEVAHSGQEALLVPPGDENALAEACLKIWEDPNLAASLTRVAAERWPHFSIQAMVENTERFYDEILGLPL